jgi:mannose-6-phosphate isomerase-like protein (cupin superfamily)
MNPKTLAAILRELASRTRGGRGSADWEQVRPVVSMVWERMQNDWPRLRDWFQSGLTDAEYRRYVALAQRLPNRLAPDERRELLELTLRGLRLGERHAADVEGTLAATEEELVPPDRASVGERPVVVGAGEGATTAYGMVHKLRAGWYDGALAVLETTVAPGRLVPSHSHSREDECSYVIAGEVGFQVGEEVVHATAGAYVVKPRGVPHAFWNSGSAPARVMEIHTPGNLGPYYDAIHAIEAGDGTEQQRESLAALQARYGITPHPERTDELARRFGVSP